MGGCMTKPQKQDPKKEGQKPKPKPNSNKKQPVSNQPPEEVKVPDQLVSVEKPQAQAKKVDYNMELLEACFKGSDKEAQKIILEHKINDIGNIKGYKTKLTLGQLQFAKREYTEEQIREWNPLLLAISQKQIKIVKLLFEKVKSFHKINCMSKPYSKETQKEKIYDHNKRLKRECFALKLAILNRDIDTFKFLWNEHRLFWNLGHFFICVRIMVKSEWLDGLKTIINSTSSKVYFMSVNNVDDFVDTVDLIRQELENYESFNKDMAKSFIEFFDNRPYHIYNYFIEFSRQADSTQGPKSFDKLNYYLGKLQQDDIQFTHQDLNEIFRIFDEKELLNDIKDQFLIQFEDRDAEIDRLFAELTGKIANPIFKNQDDLSGLIEEMDLFAFNDILMNGVKSNSLVEVFHRGFEKTIDYIFYEGFVNIRAILKKNNKYETLNEVAQFNTSFFIRHEKNIKMFTAIYNLIIDLMQLSNMLEVFDKAMEKGSKEIFDLVLHHPKFISLFNSSLELQKFIFVREVVSMAEQARQNVVIEWIKQEPYLWYYNQIKKGNNGSVYADKTIEHLQKLAENKDYVEKLEQQDRAKFEKSKKERQKELEKMAMNEQQPMDTRDRRSVRPSARGTIRHSYFPGREETKVAEMAPIVEDIKEEPEQKQVKPEKKKQQAQPRESRYEPVVQQIIYEPTMESPQPVHVEEVKVEEKPIQTFKVEEPVPECQQESPNDDEFRFQDDEIQEEEAPIENNNNNNINDMSQPVYQIQTQKFNNKAPVEKNEYIDLPVKTDNFDALPQLILDCIKANDMTQLKFLLKKYNIRNVTWLRRFDAEPVRVKGTDFEIMSQTSKAGDNIPEYDTSLWNPILYSIYYQRVEILRLLMSEYVTNFILAQRLPPVNDFTEYIIPTSKPTDWQSSKHTKGQPNGYEDSQLDPFQGSPGDYIAWQGYASMTKAGPVYFYYNPSDAKTDCFGVELAIRNRDIAIFRFLWNEQLEKWDERHFSFVFDKLLQEKWDQGIEILFQSKTAHIIFKALNPEDKDNFLNSKIIDKITDTEFWENAKSPIKITQRQVQVVMTELQQYPYGPYAVLKFPNLFLKFGLLESTIAKVTFDDVYDFAVARKENLIHLQQFIQQFQNQYSGNPQQSKTVAVIQSIYKKGNQILQESRRLPPNPEQIVQLIKLGDATGLKRYFERDDNIVLLELLSQHSGYEDSDYIRLFQNSVKSIPADDTIHLLLADNTTIDWNPLIFAIFYQRLEIVEYFCDHSKVYVRNCLTTPFIIEANEDPENEEEEKFIKEKTELFCLVLCVMLQNREIFRYLWKRCAFLWNDIHLVLLANYIFDSQWLEGIKALFATASTHQIFNAMNLYEKEKFLKFCDRSVGKQSPEMIKDFRYSMSFDPYNIYYLPILAQPEEIQFWDNDQSKEVFIKNCMVNFDEKSFILLNKIYNHYVNEFISTAITCESELLVNFAKKLSKYLAAANGATRTYM